MIYCGTLELAAGYLVPACVKTWSLSLLALRIVVLRMQLLAVCRLLRWVIALRSFIRRRRQSSAGGPAHIRANPWARIPVGPRQGRMLQVLIVSAACAVTGFLAGGLYRRGTLAHFPTAEVSGKNSAVKPRVTDEESNLALKGQSANASTEVTQATLSTPETADQRPHFQDKASAQVPALPRTGPAGKNISRPHLMPKKAKDDRLSKPRRVMQDYKGLRDYMLRR